VNDKSLVVLPLENLSPDPENAFFTDGMHAEIIATLQRALPELTVISRNSALAFKDSKMSLAEIAQKLGVANVIVGSVRRADGRVRIQLELRRASDEATLWVSPKAERELKDVFAIQSEVAEEVARVLQIRGSKGSFGGARFTTKEPRAFDLFLKARALRDADYDPRDRASRLVNMEAGIRLAEEAMKLDAGFASAAGLLANLHELAINTGGGSPESRHLHALECKRWADEAARLMSGGAGAYGLAVYYANVERDYARALRFAQNTLQALPNDADAHNFVAICFGGLGRIEEALSAYRRAIDLDPLVKLYWGNALGAAARLRRQEEFASLFERSGASNPMQNSRALHGRYMLKGELRSVNDPQEPAERVAWLWRGRKFGEAMTVVETELARPDLAALTRFSFLGSRCDLLRRLGRDVEATDTGREMLVLAEKLQSMVETGPSQKLGYSAAALVRAARMDEAIATARLYVGAASPTERATIRWTREITLAETYAHFSRSRECVELIAKLLRVPSGLTVPMLKVDPVWDNVREDAAFKALLADPKNSAPL
jgi:TolB-like protein/tetratricopeptide (TPR) repeat protein